MMTSDRMSFFRRTTKYGLPVGLVLGAVSVVLAANLSLPAPTSQVAPGGQRIVSPDARPEHQFGANVAIDGDTVLISAVGDSTEGTNAGAVYVYSLAQGFSQPEAKIIPPNYSTEGRFGFSVAIEGDTALIGAPGTDSWFTEQSGRVFVYEREGGAWSLKQELGPSGLLSGAHFGWSLDLHGQYAVISAVNHSVSWKGTGAVFIYEKRGTNWVLNSVLAPEDILFYSQFGNMVKISDDTLLVGSYFDNEKNFHAGAVYAYRLVGGQWVLEEKFFPKDPMGFAQFGTSLDIEGDEAVIGSSLDSENGFGAGSAYFFRRIGTHWVQEQKVIGGDTTAWNGFGVSVALSGDDALIGAYAHKIGNREAGTVYLFSRSASPRIVSEWHQTARIAPNASLTPEWFGFTVALDRHHLLVGSLWDDTTVANSGAAYLYSVDSAPAPMGIAPYIIHLSATSSAVTTEIGGSIHLEGTTSLNTEGIEVFFEGGTSELLFARFDVQNGAFQADFPVRAGLSQGDFPLKLRPVDGSGIQGLIVSYIVNVSTESVLPATAFRIRETSVSQTYRLEGGTPAAPPVALTCYVADGNGTPYAGSLALYDGSELLEVTNASGGLGTFTYAVTSLQAPGPYTKDLRVVVNTNTAAAGPSWDVRVEGF